MIVFLITLFLVHPEFTPTLEEINPWDEAAYINSGRMLVDKGVWPSYGDNPLVSGLYAVTYLVFRNSPDWMVRSCSVGRFFSYSLLWWCVYLLSRSLARFLNPAILIGAFIVLPLATELLRFPSDPLFAAFAGLSFWQLLTYHNKGRLTNLWWGSLLLGFSALARIDGLVLFGIFVALVITLSFAQRRLVKAVLAGVLPFGLAVSGYVLALGLATGDFELETLERAYENFESGHGIIYNAAGDLHPVLATQMEARRVFGTTEENRHSIWMAIQRNPAVYFQRLAAFVGALPARIFAAYGIRFSVLLVLLSLRGVFALWRQRQFALLLLLLAWPLHLVTAFVITLVRDGHLMFPFYIVFSLAAIGLTALLENLHHRKEVLFWFVTLLVLASASLLSGKTAVYYGAAVFLGGLVLVVALKPVFFPVETQRFLALGVMLCAALIIRGNFPSPRLLYPASGAKEQAVAFLVENLPPDTPVAASAPGPVWMAKMNYAGLSASDVPVDRTPEEFWAWMVSQGIQAIFVDHSLYNQNPKVWSLIRSQIGEGLEPAFVADEGDIQILLVKSGE